MSKTIGTRNYILRISLMTGAGLLIPLLAMQVTNGVEWTVMDFLVMGALVLTTALFYRLITEKVDKKYRTFTLIILLLLALWTWAELAVGVFTNLGS